MAVPTLESLGLLNLETGLIDCDEMERIALETRPRMLIGGLHRLFAPRGLGAHANHCRLGAQRPSLAFSDFGRARRHDICNHAGLWRARVRELVVDLCHRHTVYR